MPLAQLFSVPSGRRPVASAAVRSRAWPAAGPLNSMGVRDVMRRAQGEGRTTSHLPPLSATSMTETPWAAWALRTFSALQVLRPSRCSKPSSTYSWFITSRPLLLPSWAKKWMPSWCMPIWASCSAAVLEPSSLKAGLSPDRPTGSPQAAITSAM